MQRLVCLSRTLDLPGRLVDAHHMNKVTTKTSSWLAKAWDYLYAFVFSVFVMVGVVLWGAYLFHVQSEGSQWILLTIALCVAIITRRALLWHRGRRKHL